ncbi:hypothetical protein ACWEGE_11705, partial [Amycolatopsis sp. NPDC004747]
MRAAVRRRALLRSDRLGAALRVARRSGGRWPAVRRHGLDPRGRRTGVARRLAATRWGLRRDPPRRLVLAEGAVVVRAALVPGPLFARPFATGPAFAGRELLGGRAVAAGGALVAGRAVGVGWDVAAGRAVLRGRAVAAGRALVAGL